jgi:cytochrome c556
MRFLTIIAFMSAYAIGVATIRADGKVQTSERLDLSMKRIAPAQQAVNKAIQAMAYADAKKQLDRIESELKDAQSFWVMNKRADAIKFTQDTLAKIESLKKLLDAKTPDPSAILTGYREVGTACATCHRIYRTTDENKTFILKPGAVS